MTGRYPGYDVLAKRDSPSWNEQTRRAIDERLALDPDRHDFFSDDEWPTVGALCARILPQPPERMPPVPVAAMLDQKLHGGSGDGYRDARLPPMQEAWRRALAAFDAEAQGRHGRRFHELGADAQDALLMLAQAGSLHDPAWGGMAPSLFFAKRLLHDLVSAYYGHPQSWNEIGFGGPAAPRGYVRLEYDRRDPWEAAEARPGREEQARRENVRIR